jgi:hypothetical protein
MNDAIALENQFPLDDLTELRTNRTALSWSLANRTLAKEVAYQSGQLAGANNRDMLCNNYLIIF